MSENSGNKLLVLIASLLISLLLGAIIFAMFGYSPISVYISIFKGGLGNFSAIINSLSQTMIIAFMGLAYIIAIRSGICNVGLEGQMYVGAIVATVAGVYIPGLPSILHIPLILILAILAAGLWGSLIAVLKIKFGANEIIVAIMFNFIIQNFTSYLVSGPLKVSGTVAQSQQIRKSGRLLNLVEIPQLSSGILIFVLLTIIMFLVMNYTKFGFEVRVTGENRYAAETGGISSTGKMTAAMFISGAIAGLAGAIIVIGINGRFVDGFSPGYGWDGIAVASLAGLNIIGNIFSALLFGILKAGAMVVNRTARIPYDFILVMQACIVLLVGTPKLFEALIKKIKKIANKKGGNL